MGSTPTDDDLLLKNFYAEVSEVERDNEVLRFSLCAQL
jgi:DnaJ family protein C protein 8